MTTRLSALTRSPAMFALVFQGISGLIQVSAFFSLRGQAYLEFSAAFLLGTVLSMALLLNFENLILSGAASQSVRRYFFGIWAVGLMSAGVSLFARSMVPSFVTFCCWGSCLRLILAWSNNARPFLMALVIAAGLPLAAAGLGDVNMVMAAAMLSLPLATWRAESPLLVVDDGIAKVTLQSAHAFASYLPHTASGLIVSYVDRYVALHIVGGVSAEIYLRLVQVWSWAAFLIYPVVFQLRHQVLRAGVIRARTALGVIGAVAGALAVSGVLVLLLTYLGNRIPVLAPWVLVLIFAAIVCSQCYQIFSSLNFVSHRFGVINKITLTSAISVLALAFLLVPAVKTPEALALVLLTGWLVQLFLTVMVLRRRSN